MIDCFILHTYIVFLSEYTFITSVVAICASPTNALIVTKLFRDSKEFHSIQT